MRLHLRDLLDLRASSLGLWLRCIGIDLAFSFTLNFGITLETGEIFVIIIVTTFFVIVVFAAEIAEVGHASSFASAELGEVYGLSQGLTFVIAKGSRVGGKRGKRRLTNIAEATVTAHTAHATHAGHTRHTTTSTTHTSHAAECFVFGCGVLLVLIDPL